MGLGELIAGIPQDVVGTIPGWITAGGMTAWLALYVRRELGLKKLSIEANQVKIEARKVEQAEDEILLGHWKDEVSALRDKLHGQETRFQEALAAQEARHNDALNALEARHARVMTAAEERQARCEEEREKLATHVRRLEQDMVGIQSKVRQTSADQLRLLAASGEPIPPYALEAARRIVQNHGG